MYELKITLGDRVVQTYQGTGDVATIGRDASCDVVLDNLGVSRRHAEIRRVKDHYIISDLGSTNGVQVNGRDVTTGELKPGDEIKIAKFSLQFELGKQKERTPPEAFDINQTVALDPKAAMKKMERMRPQFVASVTRDVYHHRDCNWIKATPSDELVYFNTPEEAAQSGRRACKTCAPAEDAADGVGDDAPSQSAPDAAIPEPADSAAATPETARPESSATPSPSAPAAPAERPKAGPDDEPAAPRPAPGGVGGSEPSVPRRDPGPTAEVGTPTDEARAEQDGSVADDDADHGGRFGGERP